MKELVPAEQPEQVESSTELPKNCSTCGYYRLWHSQHAKFMHCEGDAVDHIEADAADDTGLSTWFKPPPTFCCSGYALNQKL